MRFLRTPVYFTLVNVRYTLIVIVLFFLASQDRVIFRAPTK